MIHVYAALSPPKDPLQKLNAIQEVTPVSSPCYRWETWDSESQSDSWNSLHCLQNAPDPRTHHNLLVETGQNPPTASCDKMPSTSGQCNGTSLPPGYSFENTGQGLGEMAQSLKLHAAKTDNPRSLSFSPATLVVEERTSSHKLSLTSTCMPWHMGTYKLQTHAQK